jgi:hypothetical protein
MNNYPFDTIGLSTEVIDSYQDTYDLIKTKLSIAPTGHINFQLEQFEVFKSYVDTNLRGSFVIKHLDNSSYILFIENHQITAPLNSRTVDYTECQIWALAYLKKDFGRVLIRRETLADKIIELVHPVELDFKEDMPFSDTFYVLVNDHQKAVAAIDRNFRNAVMDIREDDFIIEIVNHTLIIGNRKPVSADKAIHLAEFVARVASMC